MPIPLDAPLPRIEYPPQVTVGRTLVARLQGREKRKKRLGPEGGRLFEQGRVQRLEGGERCRYSLRREESYFAGGKMDADCRQIK